MDTTRKKWKLWNIPKVLTQYRVHATNISKTASDKTYVFDQILKELKNLNIEINQNEMLVHRTNYVYGKQDIKNFIAEREKWLRKLAEANSITHYFPEKSFKRVWPKDGWIVAAATHVLDCGSGIFFGNRR